MAEKGKYTYEWPRPMVSADAVVFDLSGDGAMVLFVVQRGDATAVAPHGAIDPAFAAALVDAHQAGVALRAVGVGFDARGAVTGCGVLPVLISRG